MDTPLGFLRSFDPKDGQSNLPAQTLFQKLLLAQMPEKVAADGAQRDYRPSAVLGQKEK